MAEKSAQEDHPAEEAETDFRSRISYADYVHLDEVMGAQHPLTSSHEEMLFITQHQTSELWMKLAIHEIEVAIAAINTDRLQPAFKMLMRLARVLDQLDGAWDVLRTMTPGEYLSFRDRLGQSSGIQSRQYRAFEFLAGNRGHAMLKSNSHLPPAGATLRASRTGRETGRLRALSPSLAI